MGISAEPIRKMWLMAHGTTLHLPPVFAWPWVFNVRGTRPRQSGGNHEAANPNNDQQLGDAIFRKFITGVAVGQAPVPSFTLPTTDRRVLHETLRTLGW